MRHLLILLFGFVLICDLQATPADDLAVAITPAKIRFSAGTSQPVGTSGWADLDSVEVELKGSSTPVHGVNITPGMKWKYGQGDWEEHLVYILNNGPLRFKDVGQPDMRKNWQYPEAYGNYSDEVTFRRPTLTEAWNHVQSKMPFTKVSALSGYAVVANYYVNESASRTKGKTSDWFTPSTNQTHANGGDYGEYWDIEDYGDEPIRRIYRSYFSRHVWVQVLKKEATSTEPPKALLYVVAFSLQQTDAAGSSTRPRAGWPWAIRFNEIEIRDIIDQNATGITKPTVTVTAVDAVATKGSSSDHGLVRVTRSGPTNTALNVSAQWSRQPSNGTGAQVLLGSSSLSTSFTIPFGAGQASRDIVVRGLAGAVYVPSETVTVTLNNQSTYEVDTARRSATVNLVDASPPVASITAPQPSAYLPSPNGMFRVSLNRAASVPVTVNYSVGGTASPGIRYRSLSRTVVFPIGSPTSDIAVIPLQTNVVTPVQTVVATLTTGTHYQPGTPRSATVNIHDNNDNVFSIIAENTTTRLGADPVRFKLVRTGNYLAPISLSLSLSGSARPTTHYTPSLPASVSFGQNVREVAFSLNAVAELAADQTLRVSLVGQPRYTLDSPSGADFLFQAKPPVSKVHINATIFSGADSPANAVDAWVPEGVTVQGGIIALGGGNVLPSTQPPTLIPQPEYLDGRWIPPVVPYGIDIRIKEFNREAQ